ncbi:MAG: aminotransferase class V-fold PLP-dependent enzyme [Desulfovibrionaceae bacterium]|nr:alanine--glyoxylate aminotransferase family protein [Desulfovibrionaceae bacterium]MDD4951453.1 aminotransferase class V-fold PLP-dependent enzyme [Desulfovibrionaceae bacterium]
MSINDFTPLKLFITGPTYIREEVREAGTLPEFGHRDKENEKRFKPIMANLKKLAKIDDGYEVVIFNGSGSTAMEASIRSLVAGGETVLNVSVGAFGDLYHNMALANGKNAVQLKFGPGRAIDLAEMDRALREHRPQVVTLTHNETSTGVVNDIEAACDLARKHGAMPLVDGVSIFGGADVRISQARPAMYSTSTQKSLGLPAGFGIAFIAPEAVEKAAGVADRGHASDILKQLDRAAKFQTLTTPNCTLANQMCVQLDYIVNQEGVDNRFKRHALMRDMVRDWVAGLDGFELFAQEGRRSPTLTTVRAPQGLGSAGLKAVKERMRARGYLFDPGYGKINTALEKGGQRCAFRVGHMGDITPDMLRDYLSDLEEVFTTIK